MILDDAKAIATMVKDITTAVAIIVGGGWAIWKWGFSERLRKKQEISSPDGHLSATCTRLGDDKLIVSLEATWRNRGPLPIELDAEHSHVSAFKIDESHDIGSLSCDRDAISTAKLFNGHYIMEPKTDSVMHHQFVVPFRGVYFFRWVIGLSPRHSAEFGGSGVYVCSREVVVDCKADSERAT